MNVITTPQSAENLPITVPDYDIKIRTPRDNPGGREVKIDVFTETTKHFLSLPQKAGRKAGDRFLSAWVDVHLSHKYATHVLRDLKVLWGAICVEPSPMAK
ncbi:hypothetical protein [Ruegeria sp. HKCCE3926]|uniref:hypothetical protein n=1 Tax=Ruegeria sp. HKCCE3926 TaxID=2794831 RepID=UPI001AE87A31|nr:hypothetical protein [Ruegeria sp. HKCCE3926]